MNKILNILIGLLIISTVKCAGPSQYIEVKTILQCDNNTLIVCAHGEYYKTRAGTYEIFPDANGNKVFDEPDRQLGMKEEILFNSNELYMSQPIKLDTNWTKGYIFVRVATDLDTTISTVASCMSTTTDYRPNN